MALQVPRFTYQDLAQLPDDGKRYELADGELVVSPAPTYDHQRIVWQFSRLLMRAEDAGFGQGVVSPIDVVFGRYATTQPDLLFIGRERLHIIANGRVQGAPDLIIEILSPWTREHDLGWKKTLYAREGVRYYWVVDPIAQSVMSFTFGGGGYAPVAPLSGDAILACPLFPEISSTVARFFPDNMGHYSAPQKA